MNRSFASTVAALAITVALNVTPAGAHCDTLNGPVVATARVALEKGDITPVLKWVKPEAEPEIRAAFKQALAVRKGGPEARDLADRYFFETLVRVHRAGEGAPYAGLKPADAVDPAVQAADRALDGGGSINAVVNMVTGDIAEGIRLRWQHVQEAKKHADDSVEAGRRYVEAYVEYVHYIENLRLGARAGHGDHAEGALPGPARIHK